MPVVYSALSFCKGTGREEKERNTSLSLQHSSRGGLGERLTTLGFAPCLLTKSRSRTEAASCPRSHRSYLGRQWRLGCCGRSEFNKARHDPLTAVKVTLIFKPSPELGIDEDCGTEKAPDHLPQQLRIAGSALCTSVTPSETKSLSVGSSGPWQRQGSPL